MKLYKHSLGEILKEYNKVCGSIPRRLWGILSSAVDDVFTKIRPGLLSLTWMTVNIDAYLHGVRVGIAKLAELVADVKATIEQRVDAPLRSIAAWSLVDPSSAEGLDYCTTDDGQVLIYDAATFFENQPKEVEKRQRHVGEQCKAILVGLNQVRV